MWLGKLYLAHTDMELKRPVAHTYVHIVEYYNKI